MSTIRGASFTPTDFGPYRLEAFIGRGAVGEVYRATDTRLRRPVALKILAPDFAQDEEFKARFRRESEIVSGLMNPHIVPVHGFDEIDGRLYLDMRLIDGRDLGVLLQEEGALAPARAADIVVQVASALSAAHSKGLIHRDVKPANVLVVPTEVGAGDFAYLADFGVARSVGGRNATTITGKGATVGTVEYMAPERFSADEIDHRVDVYALGCVLYECLTGKKPFQETAAAAMMWAHVNGPIPRPSDTAGVPRAFDAVVAKALAKSSAERYPTAGALAEAVRDAARSDGRGAHGDSPPPSPPTSPPPGPGPRPGPGPGPGPGPSSDPEGDRRRAEWERQQRENWERQQRENWERQQRERWEREQQGRQQGKRQGGRRSRKPLVIVAAAVLTLVTVVVVALVVTLGGGPPSSTYSVAQMFDVPDNGYCSAADDAFPELETDSLSCTRSGSPIGTVFSRYTVSAQEYVDKVKVGDSTWAEVYRDGCRVTYQGTYTSQNGSLSRESIIVFQRSPFVVTKFASQSAVTAEQLTADAYNYLDDNAVCGL